MVIISIFLIIIVLALGVLLFTGNPQSSLDGVQQGTLLVLVLLLVPICILFIVALLRNGIQRIEGTEEGITSYIGKRADTVRWDEARLFAVYGAYGKTNNKIANTYELVGANSSIIWIWVRRANFNYGMAPSGPVDEYNRQMRGLISLVAAKTGLPLYDLR